MEIKAAARFVRISPRKARLVMGQVRGKKVEEALNMLSFASQRGAGIVKKLIHSAVANAQENAKMDVDALYISKIYADEGPTLKRWRPRALGRATRIRKRTSHLTVVLGEK
ncbi:MAG: large subunit ribosomal protein [Thermodesulfobacteriota bacterium]|nr:large subunit ribosomal protein [Thermodesulfobacteriota bacterium]